MPAFTTIAVAACISLLALACQPKVAADEVLLTGSEGLFAVDLDTAEHRLVEIRGEALPYHATLLAGGTISLLAYVDAELRPGYALVSSTGRVLHRRYGFAPYPVGDELVLGVRLSEVLEQVAYDSAVEIVPLNGGDPRTMPRSLPLTPLAVPADSLAPTAASAQEPPLILTYRPKRFGLDLLYPWDKKLLLTAIDAQGSTRWEMEVTTEEYLADLSLLAATPDLFLLFGLYNQFGGEYFALNRADGKLLWQRPLDIIPWTQTVYPYLNFGEVLPVEMNGMSVGFPAQRPSQAEAGKLRLELNTGDAHFERNSPWVEVVRSQWEATASRAAADGYREETLADGAILRIGRDRLVLERGGQDVWMRERVPVFGEGLELAAAGDKLMLLVEAPCVEMGLAAQGLPYLLEVETGEDFANPAGAGAAWLQPVELDGRRLILTKAGVRWLRKAGS